MEKKDVEKLKLFSEYDQRELAKLWGYKSYDAIRRGIVTPSGKDFIVLFVTEKKDPNATDYYDELVDYKLLMSGEEKHGNDERLANNLSVKKDTIFLFYRAIHHRKYKFYGEVILVDATLNKKKPSKFVFDVLSLKKGESGMKFYSLKISNASSANLVEEIKKGSKNFTVEQLNQYVDELKIGDFVFIMLGGDRVPWDKGLIGLSEIVKEPYDKGYDKKSPRNFKLDLKMALTLDSVIERKDFVYYLNTFDAGGIGPNTKGEQNQAIKAITEDQACAVLRAMLERKGELESVIRSIFNEDICEKIFGLMPILVLRQLKYSGATGGLSARLNKINYGPPGTGKTFHVADEIATILNCTNDEAREALAGVGKLCDRVKFVTFHQSYGYEDFIEGIKPVLLDEDGKEIEDPNYEGKTNLVYKVKDGVFKEFCNNAKDKDEPYVFVIDEINRGNISKIFGELITLVEEDKRLGNENSMQVTLPYSKDLFGIPSNVYIIGTMNTADRSLAHMDTALRRRFKFEEMMPDSEKLSDNCEGINLQNLLKRMNDRIEYLYDREHTVGHAFFMKDGKSIETLDELIDVFKSKIIPLLQEYFYDDYEKIKMVLRDDEDDGIFIKIMDSGEITELFGENISEELDDIKRYVIVKDGKTPDEYKEAFEKMSK